MHPRYHQMIRRDRNDQPSCFSQSLLEKLDVFTNPQGLKGMVFPPLLSITQRRAQRKLDIRMRHMPEVRPSVPHVIEQHRMVPGHDTMNPQPCDLICHSLRSGPVIGVKMTEEFSSGIPRTQVPHFPRSFLPIDLDVPNRRIRRNQRCRGIRAVVHDDQFFVRVRLPLVTLDGVRNIGCAILRRQDARD